MKKKLLFIIVITFLFIQNASSQCGMISLIGEFSGWAEDHYMTRDTINPDLWTTFITLTEEDDQYGEDNIVEMKFREDHEWYVNWGSDEFPSGTGVQNGSNIPVPLDGTGLTTDYFVTFNCITGEYYFQSASGLISIIGDFTGWTGDIPMNRDAANPNLWKLSRSWYADSYVKFRENNDWTIHWGSSSWPSGTGFQDGPNIPLVQGTYDITFNASTGEYAFTPNPGICGEIGLVGDFNNWGDGDPVADVWMTRDPSDPGNFILEYTFEQSTGVLFRENADMTFTNTWGGTTLCQNGLNDPDHLIQVPEGSYLITFNHDSWDYCFTKTIQSVFATKVSAMSLDGQLDEMEWTLDQQLTRIIEGEVTDDLNQVHFGIAYNNDYLYIGGTVNDAYVFEDDWIKVFIDPDHSGGPYEPNDIMIRIYSTGNYIILNGPSFVPGIAMLQTANGYNFEIAIPRDVLEMDPENGSRIGFDLQNADDDVTPGWPEYWLSWNGDQTNQTGTSMFGHLFFGYPGNPCISLYNETLGDIILHELSDQPGTSVVTYEFDNDYAVVFRRNYLEDPFWGGTGFPDGSMLFNGPAIQVNPGRYRITLDQMTGNYTFTNATADEGVAYAYFTETPIIVDGDLYEYDFQYGCDHLVQGEGPGNNVVTWGAIWDGVSLYIGVRVTDEVVEGTGNPWDNDGIEFFLDGNNDKDGLYDEDFDTRMILDALNLSDLWTDPDGVPVTDYEAIWIATDLGYNVELRFAWSNIGFAPGNGRVIGWSLGNNDSDNGTGRDYQTVWFGTGSNGSNTADLGELQLAGGPYVVGLEDVPTQSDFILYPNPADGNVNLRLNTGELSDNLTICVSDITGRTMKVITQHLNDINNIVTIVTDDLPTGMYIVNITTQSGMRAVQKLVVY
ncbi:MAG: T9SS type A sorting domain-containing protein [Lentimicrobiaceae bacterium]|nr:T9SS type A sorting domain-containing protein [Lentimicrobiaceae bacterium]